MKWLKRTTALALSLTMAFILAACGEGTAAPQAHLEASPEAGQPLFQAGTYAAVGEGRNGPVKVKVVFSDAAMDEIVVLEHQETAGVADAALDAIPKAILEAQSLAVDAVAGCTLTSDAILTAVSDCVAQAGGDAAAMRQASAPADEQAPTALQADVVVVGGGLSGVTAAIEAANQGAKVILFEKLGMLGGSSALSGGGIGAAGSKLQAAHGLGDSAAAWKQLWQERAATSPRKTGYPDWALVDRLLAGAPATIDWLTNEGVAFRKPEGFGVDPVERLHFYDIPEASAGAALLACLGEKAAAAGVDIRLSTPVLALIVENGAVCGVRAEGNGQAITARAKAVVLASGGFTGSPALLERFTPEVAPYAAYSVATVGNTGDGILMAEAVGAALYEDPWVLGLGLATPVKNMGGFYWYGNYMLVNGEGNRFTNEASHYAIVANDAIYHSPGGSFMVFDSGKAFEPFVAAAEQSLGDPNLFKADTIEALASAINVSPENLHTTIAAYGKGEDAFGKAEALTPPMETGPFYAVRYYPCTMGTIGGVKVGENQEVLSTGGAAIPGLYAAGEMQNRPYYAQVYMTGSSLQIAATTGIRAGKAAAKQ